MNPLQNLTSMELTWTTLIEFGIIFLFMCIFPWFLDWPILLGFLGFVGLKAYQYFLLQKLSSRPILFNQDIPKEKKADYYSSNWKKIIDFGEYMVPNKLAVDELLIKVHSASLNPVDFKFIKTRLPFYWWILFPNIGIDFSGEVIKIGDLVIKYRPGDTVFGFASIASLQEYTITKEKVDT